MTLAAHPAGRVTIAGAGPGDPELLTVRTRRLIDQVDAIVCDALVSQAIRELFPLGRPVFDVGKRAGHTEAADQDRINRLLVRLAGEGLHVLRLKGGDPLIFGRGGEEALYLAAHRIRFEIVPGISAVNGAAAAAGIPLTHRGLSGSCAILNGYTPQLDQLNWPALAALGGTLVFLMARRSTGEIARRLLAHGADPRLYLVLVEAASLPAQTLTVMALADAARAEPLPATEEPALVLVSPAVEPFVRAGQLHQTLVQETLAETLALNVQTSSDLYAAGEQNRPDRGWR